MLSMRVSAKRATVYFDPEIHRALRLKSAATERSISDVVNEAVKLSLAEDADDLAAFDSRAREPALDFDYIDRLVTFQGSREQPVRLQTVEEALQDLNK